MSDPSDSEPKYTLRLTDDDMAGLLYLIDLACRGSGLSAGRVAGRIIGLCDDAYAEVLATSYGLEEELEAARVEAIDAAAANKLH